MKKPEINRRISKVNFTDANRKEGQIKYLVKHYVGATGGAKANADYFHNTYRGASAHYFVGHDGEIWQVVEDNDIAWHCGASSYKHADCRNSNSIGIELCCKKDKNGKWYYTEKTKDTAVLLFTYLMEKYHIAPDQVLRHYDVTGKECGEPDVRTGNKVWNSFKKELEAADTDPTVHEKKEEKESGYRIVTTCDILNIRSGAGTDYPVVSQIRNKNQFTIIEEKNGWGKLKSGIGWIKLSYTEKI